jgi:hypothetical protein
MRLMADELVLSNEDALEGLFEDLPNDEVRARFEDVRFEVARDGAQGFLAATAVAGAWGGALAERLRTRPRGSYARIFFPSPAHLDMAISPAAERDEPTFEESYVVDSLVPKLVTRFLGEELIRVAVDLWPRFHVQMRDEFLDVGPLSGTPHESATVVAELVRAMKETGAPTTPSETEGAVLDSFCFYCGNAVSSAATRCPHCDGDLSE